jgi:predicted RNA-binding Zn-ribbon protein involved in translation (DUF1610 family)
MNVKRIVVDESEELPENCGECDVCQGISPKYLYCLGKHIDVDAHSTRPDWCPLVVDECCEWVANKYTASYHTPHETMGLRIIVETDREDYQFCPNCGKRIVYREKE